MDVSIQDVGPCRKQIKITVPQSEVQAKIDENYEKLGESAVVAGFRRGHVPKRLIERRYGEEVIEEVKETILNDAAQRALTENNLKALGTPSFDNVEFAPDKDCVFEITLEVEPEFDLPEYKGLKLQRPSAEVTDEELESGLEHVRRQQATLAVQPEKAKVQQDDYITADWDLRSEDELAASEKEDELAVRGRRFGGVELEQDLAEALGGAKSGDEREIKGRILDEYPIEKWRGKDCVVRLTLKEIRRPELPELDEAFAQSLDFDSVDELKESVRRHLAQEKERSVNLALERQMFDQLIAAAPFDLPEGVLKAQARNIMLRQQYRLRMRGMPEEEMEKHLEELRDASEEAAERNLKIFFILNKIADKEKLFVTENEVENHIAAMANAYQTTVQAMRRRIEQEGSLNELRAGMREDKVISLLMENAEITEE